MKKLKKGTKKYDALYYLAKGYSQSWLVRFKGYNKSVLSRYVKEFLDQKLLVKYTPATQYDDGRVILYRATPRAKMLLTGEKSQPLHWGMKIRLHNTRFKFYIETKIKRRISWHKTTTLKNGVKKFYFYFPTITLEYIPSKESHGIIIVHPHETYIESFTEEHHMKFLHEDMLKVKAWLQRVLYCRLSDPIQIQEKHLALPIRNPQLMSILDSIGIIRVGDVWIDASKRGFQWGEIESTNADKLMTMEKLQWSDLNIPQRVDALEDNISRLIHSFDALQNTVEKLNANIETLLTMPKRPDDKRDVV